MTWLIGIIILVLLQISRCVDWCPCVSYLNYRLTAERNNNSDIKSTADGSMQGINNSQIINDGQINLSQGPNEESIVLCMINIGQTGDGFKESDRLHREIVKYMANPLQFSHLSNVYPRFVDQEELTRIRTWNKTINSKLKEISNCSVIMKFVEREEVSTTLKNERQCPGKCLPLPYSEIPFMTWLLPPYNHEQSLTCSLKLSGALHHHKHHVMTGGNTTIQTSDELELRLHLILHSIARRRIEECQERELWPEDPLAMPTEHTNIRQEIEDLWPKAFIRPKHSRFPRRKIYGLIIWVGSNARIDLPRDQSEALQHQYSVSDLTDEKKIYGWIATEDQHPCRKDAITCKQWGYHWMMPSSKLSGEGTHTGWGCAQRRPLRALGHTLLLFDPDFLFLVDDDTYVNIKLIQYGTILSKTLLSGQYRDGVLGQLTGGNKVTKGGFYYGGAGYLMTKPLLHRLIGHDLSGPDPYGDRWGYHLYGLDRGSLYREMKHLTYLGVLEEAMSSNRSDCNGSCIALNSNNTVPHFIGMRATLGVRLVDLCTNLFSDEGTCYHSDHALSRCFIHGVYADAVNVPCQGFKISSNPDLVTGMCMGVDICYPSLLTCHRWKPNVTSDELEPIGA